MAEPDDLNDRTLARDRTQRRHPRVLNGEVEAVCAVGIRPGSVIRRRYVLENIIGAGGMGQVWKAKDLVRVHARDPNPFVALKLLNADFDNDPDGFVFLQRETKKAQELAHPNVATVYDFDTDDDGSGHAFMSMELLQGETLEACIHGHPNGVGRIDARPLILGMARGLEYAHKKGIVHSDFKPGNVFLTSSREIKVLDFGIARGAPMLGVDLQADSFDAGILGGLTPAYASPQMLKHDEPHPADDVYAMGLVSYELLTGRLPIARVGSRGLPGDGGVPARIRGIRRHEWRAIAKALEPERRKRWQDAGEFLRAYEGRSMAVAALGVLAITLTLAAGVFWYDGYRATRPAQSFETLAPEVQAAFRVHMANADGEWRLVQQGMGDESLNAASEYGQAYALHPRNPEAVAGLKKSADYILQRLRGGNDRADYVRQLESVRELSDYYATYQPLVSAIDSARAK